MIVVKNCAFLCYFHQFYCQLNQKLYFYRHTTVEMESLAILWNRKIRLSFGSYYRANLFLLHTFVLLLTTMRIISMKFYISPELSDMDWMMDGCDVYIDFYFPCLRFFSSPHLVLLKLNDNIIKGLKYGVCVEEEKRKKMLKIKFMWKLVWCFNGFWGG